VSALRVTGLHKSFGVHPVLRGLDLEVPSGSFTAILGPSGSGKTTLLRVLAGFAAPDQGSVTIGAQVVDDANTHVKPERRRIGYVPQDGALFPHLTVAANVGFGLPRSQRAAAATELMEMVGLSGLGQRYPHELSGGQQQRVALARAMAIKPDIVLLDEPFASLDAELRASVRDDVRRVTRAAATTAVLVTHDQDEALSIADLVAVLRDGVVAQSGTPHDVYAHPIDPELARFLGEANILEGIYDGTTVETLLGSVPARAHDPLSTPCRVSILIRPEAIELGAANGHGAAGTITRIDYHGHDTVIHVRPQAAPDRSLIVRTSGDVHPAVGAAVALRTTAPALVWHDPPDTPSG
jgi:iron(III) transport system ATP-binding protein